MLPFAVSLCHKLRCFITQIKLFWSSGLKFSKTPRALWLELVGKKKKKKISNESVFKMKTQIHRNQIILWGPITIFSFKISSKCFISMKPNPLGSALRVGYAAIRGREGCYERKTKPLMRISWCCWGQLFVKKNYWRWESCFFRLMEKMRQVGISQEQRGGGWSRWGLCGGSSWHWPRPANTSHLQRSSAVASARKSKLALLGRDCFGD